MKSPPSFSTILSFNFLGKRCLLRGDLSFFSSNKCAFGVNNIKENVLRKKKEQMSKKVMRILQKAENAYEPEGIAHLQNCTGVWQKAFVCLLCFVVLFCFFK